MGVRWWLAAVSVLVAWWWSMGWKPQLAVTVLDVGQGDAIMLEDGGQQVLVDGGAGRVVLERLAEVMPTEDRRIEVVVATHPQRDHLEGLLHVLERYEVGMVIVSPVRHDSELREAWLTRLVNRRVPVQLAQPGQQLRVGRWQLKVIGPLVGEAAGDAVERDVNNGSVVMRADGCAVADECVSMVLTGDAEAPVEQMLARAVPADVLDVEVLKVGHHGSNSSTTRGWLEATSPELAIISVGADNTYGHPDERVLGRLAEAGVPVARTDEVGSVRLWWGRGKWWLGMNQTKAGF